MGKFYKNLKNNISNTSDIFTRIDGEIIKSNKNLYVLYNKYAFPGLNFERKNKRFTLSYKGKRLNIPFNSFKREQDFIKKIQTFYADEKLILNSNFDKEDFQMEYDRLLKSKRISKEMSDDLFEDVEKKEIRQDNRRKS